MYSEFSARSWSVDQCRNFMLEHSTNSESAIMSEIRRYTYIPGQALCYMYGFKRIIALREKAKRELGTLELIGCFVSCCYVVFVCR